jgi:transcription elongation GreA/GreB family factor
MGVKLDIKQHFLTELKETYQERIAGAARAESEAVAETDLTEREPRRSEDRKQAALQDRLASGHRRRRKQAVAELERLLEFAERGLRRFRSTDRVDLGALVDVRVEGEEGEDERTLFFLPVGAGTELRGPGGDGYVTVVTPGSPVGKALFRAEIDDGFEIVIDGREREWTVVDLA